MKDRSCWHMSWLAAAAMATLLGVGTTVAQSSPEHIAPSIASHEGRVQFSPYRPGDLRCFANWELGRFYVSAGGRGNLRFWEANTLSPAAKSLPILRDSDGGVEFLSVAAGRFIAAADARGRVVVFESEAEVEPTGNPAETMKPFGEFRSALPLSALCVLANGQVLVGDEESGLSLWQKQSQGFELLQRVELGGMAVITAICIVELNKLGVANEDGDMFLLKRGGASKPLEILRSAASEDGVRNLYWCSTFNRMIGIGDFPGSFEWALADLKAQPKPGPIKAAFGPISALATSQHGAMLFARESGEIMLQTTEGFHSTLMDSMPRIRQLGFHSQHTNQQGYVALGHDGLLRTWSAKAFWLEAPPTTTVAKPLWGAFGPGSYARRRSPVLRGAWAPKGYEVGFVTQSGVCQVWDVAKGVQRAEWSLPEPVAMTALAAFPDGKSWISGDLSGRIARWKVGAPEVAWVYEHGASINAVAVDQAGRWIASGGWDGKVKLFSASDQVAKPKVLSGHKDAIKGIAFAPQGKRLASVADDGALIIWDVATATQLKRIEAHVAPVHDVAWSPDGQKLATGSLDESLRVFDAQSGERTRIIRGFKRGINTLEWLRTAPALMASDSAGSFSWASVTTGDVRTDPTSHELACTWAGLSDRGGGTGVASASMTGDLVTSYPVPKTVDGVERMSMAVVALPRFGGPVLAVRRHAGGLWQVTGPWGRRSVWKLSSNGEGERVPPPEEDKWLKAQPISSPNADFLTQALIPNSDLRVGCDAQGRVSWQRLDATTGELSTQAVFALPRPGQGIAASKSLTLIATDCGRIWLFGSESGDLLGVGGANDDGRWWWRRSSGEFIGGRVE